MMVMTAKLNFKKILMLLTAVAAVILALILLMGGGGETHKTSAPSMEGNTERVGFLQDMGWDVQEQPVKACQVKMPKQTSPVYERYNNLQKSQGYDLKEYAGKKAMRYVYTVKNFPGATEPVYATLLVYDGKVIGGDITDTSTGGKIRGLRKVRKAASVPRLPSDSAVAEVPDAETAPSEMPH